MVTKYTRRAEDTGWLTVRLTRSGALTALCEYTAVSILRDAGGRTFFTILDGYVAVGEEASLKTGNAMKYLSSSPPGGAASMTVKYLGAPAEENSPFKGKLKQQWADLSFNGQTARITLNSVWNSTFTPIPPGTHSIMTPDYPHAGISTQGYVAATPGMIGNDVWFPISVGGGEVNSSRYVHVGHLSDGCVTVHELAKWTAVYEYLISHRVSGSRGRRVGLLTVTK